jgi:hypothetical protein
MSWSFVVKNLHHPRNSSISLVSKPEFCEEELLRLGLLLFFVVHEKFQKKL